MKSTLTYLRTKINTLTRLLDTPSWIGPAGLIVAIAINQALIELGFWPVQVALLYLPVVLAAMIGLWPGLISAGMVSLYSIWLDPHDYQRTLVVPLSLLALSLMVGYRTRALRAALAQAMAEHTRADENQDARNIVDTLNGNIIRVEEARQSLLNILEVDRLDESTRKRLRSVLHTLNNLALATQGWKELRDLKADIERAKTRPLEGNADAVE